jgi:hypothetical protein
MLLDKISERARVSLRPDCPAAKARITFRLERSAVVESDCEKAKPIWCEHYVREQLVARRGDFAFGNLCPAALETFSHIVVVRMSSASARSYTIKLLA